jgi:hypothetical protein
MRSLIRALFALSLLVAALPLPAQEEEPHPRASQTKGPGAAYGARDAAVISMMGWGIGLAIGIAILCGSLSQNTASDTP